MNEKRGLSGAAKIIITVVVVVVAILGIMFVASSLSGGDNPHQPFRNLHG